MTAGYQAQALRRRFSARCVDEVAHPEGGDPLVLIDLDSAFPIPAREISPTFDALLAMRGNAGAVVAAGTHASVQRIGGLVDFGDILHAVAPSGENAADCMLLGSALYAASLGQRTFVLASGDGDFARLARLGSLRIAMPLGSQVSQRLLRAADSVIWLEPQLTPTPLTHRIRLDALPEFTGRHGIAS